MLGKRVSLCAVRALNICKRNWGCGRALILALVASFAIGRTALADETSTTLEGTTTVPTTTTTIATTTSTTLSPNCVGLWRFDEGSGTTASDSSGHGNHGTIEGGETWVSGTNAVSNAALDFDGADDYIVVDHSSSIGALNQITVSAWVRPDVLTGNRRILEKSNQYAFYLHRPDQYNDHNDRIRFDIAGNLITCGIGACNDWIFATATYDGENLRLYLNGLLAHTKAHYGSIASGTANLIIGNKGTPGPLGDGLDGTLDDVRICNVALSEEEVWDLFESYQQPNLYSFDCLDIIEDGLDAYLDPADLDAALSGNQTFRNEFIGAVLTLCEFVPQPMPTSLRDEVFDRMEGWYSSYSSLLADASVFEEPHQYLAHTKYTISAAFIWLAGPMWYKDRISAAMGLTGTRAAIWDDCSFVLMDNAALTPGMVQTVYDVASATVIPDNYYYARTFNVRPAWGEHFGDAGDPIAPNNFRHTDALPQQRGPSPSTWPWDFITSDNVEFLSDWFAVNGVSHYLHHSMHSILDSGNYFWQDDEHRTRLTHLISDTGQDPFDYLNYSHGTGSIMRDEVYADIAIAYYAHSGLLLERAIEEYHDNDNPKWLDQFLFFAAEHPMAVDDPDHVWFYSVNDLAELTRYEYPVERDSDGYIRELTIDNVVHVFTLNNDPQDPHFHDVVSYATSTLYSTTTTTTTTTTIVPGLVAWWKFDEMEERRTYDSSGCNNEGHLNEYVEWTTDSVADGAVYFEPNAAIMVADAPCLNPTEEITLASWVRVTDLVNKDTLVAKLYAQGTASWDDKYQYRLYFDNGNLYFNIDDVDTIGAAVTDTEWLHVAATYDRQYMRLYFNGQQVDYAAGTAAIPQSYRGLTIAIPKPSGTAVTNLLTGTLDELRIYNCALSPTEVSDLYDSVQPTAPMANCKLVGSKVVQYQDPPGVNRRDTLTVNLETDAQGALVEDTWRIVRLNPRESYIMTDVASFDVSSGVATVHGHCFRDGAGGVLQGFFADFVVTDGAPDQHSYRIVKNGETVVEYGPAETGSSETYTLCTLTTTTSTTTSTSTTTTTLP